jgi:hypothetical protein
VSPFLLLMGCPFPDYEGPSTTAPTPTDDTASPVPTPTGDPVTPTPVTPTPVVPLGTPLTASTDLVVAATGTSLQAVTLRDLTSVQRVDSAGQSLLVGLADQAVAPRVAASVVENAVLHGPTMLGSPSPNPSPASFYAVGAPAGTPLRVPVLDVVAQTCHVLAPPAAPTVVPRPGTLDCGFAGDLDADGTADLVLGYRSADDTGGVEVQGSAASTRRVVLSFAGYSLPGRPARVVDIGGTTYALIGSQGDASNPDAATYDPAKVAIHPLGPSAGDVGPLTPEQTDAVVVSGDRYVEPAAAVDLYAGTLAVGFHDVSADTTAIGGEVQVVSDTAVAAGGTVAPFATLTSTQVDDGFGAAVVVTDLDGSGGIDVLVGAPDADRVYWFQDVGSTDLSTDAAHEVWTFSSSLATATGLGIGLQRVGDLDGDGCDEIAVESTNHDNTSAGSTYIVLSRCGPTP